MLAVVGTVPDLAIPLLDAPVALVKGQLMIGDYAFQPERGTLALLGAAAQACLHLDLAPPHAFLIGDEGLGKGSRCLYAHIESVFPQRNYSTLVFHYLQPDVDWHNKVLFAVEQMKPWPTLIADAGFMYAAKMSGQAGEYDLFTPDAGELAFLADEEAPHPFYTRGFILQGTMPLSDLITRTYAHENGASHLLVKGKVDVVANYSGVLAEISEPTVEAMEAIGGTGDTITGLACALVEYGLAVSEAARIAAMANRFAGEAAVLHPGSQISAVLPHIPTALSHVMSL